RGGHSPLPAVPPAARVAEPPPRHPGPPPPDRPPPPVAGPQPRIEGAPIGLDPGANLAAEPAEVLEQALDLSAQEADDPDLVARVQAALDLGDVLGDAVTELVERGEKPGLAGGLDHGGGQAQLGEEIGLDGQVALHGRAADIGEPVEGMNALEHDRFHLGAALGNARSLPLDAVEHGLAEAPLDHRVDRRALLLDE